MSHLRSDESVGLGKRYARNTTGRASTSRNGECETLSNPWGEKPRDVEKLLVFEGVVDVAVFVPGSLGDPPHQFSTKVVHHVVEGVRSPVFSAIAMSSSCPRVQVIGRVQ